MNSAGGQSKNRALFIGPAAAVLVGLALHVGANLPAGACWTAAITTLCGLWWIFEPIPIPATAILPFALFPLVGVMDDKAVAAGYGHHIVLLFAGGFMLAKALEKSGAHRRLAILMIRVVGGKGGRRLVLGFMLASAVLSMWISNTATTLMLLPVALAVLEQLDEQQRKSLSVPLMLSLAYAASIGGMGTPIGTPPNALFVGIYEQTCGTAISFAGWMKLAFPVMVVMFPISWLWLTRKLGTPTPIKLPVLGPWRTEETRVMIVFVLTAAAWIFRKDPSGGWSGLVGAGGVGDSTVALLAAVALFLCPNGHGDRLLDWKTARKIPWGILLLFGAGLTIAKAFKTSGLDNSIGELLICLKGCHRLPMIAGLSLSIGFITEVMSNTAMSAMVLPLLAAAAKVNGISPALLMIPATMSVSLAFMLPIATPPNAIVYSSGHLSIRTMVREGFFMTLIGAATVAVVCYLTLPLFLKQ